jgi:hypothetical protein
MARCDALREGGEGRVGLPSPALLFAWGLCAAVRKPGHRMRVLPDFYPDDPNNSVQLQSALSVGNCGANQIRAGKVRTRFSRPDVNQDNGIDGCLTRLIEPLQCIFLRLPCRAP